MKDSVLGKLIASFSAADRRRFRSYIHSPFFNQQERMQRATDYLLDYAPEEWQRDAFIQRVWAGEHPTQTTFHNTTSDLARHVLRYLSLLRWEGQTVAVESCTTDALLDRELYDLLPRQLQREQRAVERYPFADGEGFRQKAKLAYQYDRWELYREKRTYSPYLQAQADALDVYYQLEKWRLACDMVSRNLVVQANYNLQFIKPFVRFYQENPEYLAQNPSLDLYYALYELLRESPDREHYQRVQRKLTRTLDQFPPEEQRNLYSYLLNFCVRQINSGDGSFYQKVLDLYKWLLDREIIVKNGMITQWTYTNIITAGIRLHDYEWTERFIRDYQSYLQPDQRHNVYTYNLVNLYFERGFFDQALSTLQEVQFTDTFYQVAARLIQLRIYYLEETVEPFFSLTLSTERFLERNKHLSDYQKKSNQNFIRFIKRLFKLKIRIHERDRKRYKEQYQRLKTGINGVDVLTHRGWLARQLEVLNA